MALTLRLFTKNLLIELKVSNGHGPLTQPLETPQVSSGACFKMLLLEILFFKKWYFF